MLKSLIAPLLKKFSKLFISMTLVSALAIGVFTGLSGGYKSLELSLNTFVRDYHYADIAIVTNPTASAIKTKIAGIEGVQAVNQRIAYDTSVRLPNLRQITGRFFYYQPDNFQDFYVWEEDIAPDVYNVGVEKHFADKNGLKIGDVVTVSVNSKTYQARIGRIVSAPECLVSQVDGYSIGGSSDFGTFYVSSDNNFLGPMLDMTANQFLIKTLPDRNSDQVQRILDSAEEILEKRTDVLSGYTYDDSPVKTAIDRNLNGLKVLSTLVPAFFYITMICVCSLFFVQIIRQSRRDIGILKSQGFHSSELRALFCVISLITDFAGCVIGFGMGLILNRIVSVVYLQYFTCPVVMFTLNVPVCFVSVLCTLAAGQLSAFLGTSLITKIQPSEAMSRDVSRNVKIPANLTHILKTASPNTKIAVFSVFRNIKGFVFSVVCIFATVVIIISTIEYGISLDFLVKNLFEKRLTFDCQIMFTKPISEENLNIINGSKYITESETDFIYSRKITLGDVSKTVMINAIEPDSRLIGIFDTQNRPISLPDTGIVLEKHFADGKDISAFKTALIDDIPFNVESVSNQSMKRIQYISKTQAQALGEPDRWVIHCNCTSESEVVELVKDMDGYSYCTFTRLVRQSLQDAFDNHYLGVYILIAFASFMGFLIVYNTTQTNLNDMKKEISVMRSIGFQVSDISKIWLTQTSVQLLISLISGLPCGALISRFVISEMSDLYTEYPFVNSPALYIITVAVVLFYISISHILAMKTIRKWNLAENVKEKE